MATTPCTPVDPQSLEWCEGKVNLPGIRSKVYYIPKRDIASFPTLPAIITTDMGDLATYAGSFTLVTGKQWMELDVLIDKSPVKSAGQGSKPSKSFLNTATFVCPRVDAQAAGFARIANNDDYVFIIQETAGSYRVIGNEMYLLEMKIDQASGSKATDEMSTTIEASVTDVCPAPYYTGEIITENGTINEVITPSAGS
jgi:hypothetical protein